MRQTKLYISLISVVVLIACQAQRKLFDLYKMNEFNLGYGYDFVNKIQYQLPVNEISIVDTRANGNEFYVNRQWIFLDTTQQDQPNYYSYKKRAAELKIPADSLLNCLKTFYKIGVNDFSRDANYYRFRVIVGLTINRGYIYSQNQHLQPGDTLPATSVRNLDYHFKIVLAKQIDKHWFEYYETP